MLKTACVALHLCSSVSGNAFAYDGDTLRVQGVAVRLWGLDCEELADPHGRTAQAAMRALIEHEPVTCQLTGKRSYKREVGTCTVHGLDVAEWMVSHRLCLDCARYSGGHYRQYEPDGARARLKQAPYC
jgi:endonuclease YncB( thermonuclease family)